VVVVFSVSSVSEAIVALFWGKDIAEFSEFVPQFIPLS
jgi:hypothetical protein